MGEGGNGGAAEAGGDGGDGEVAEFRAAVTVPGMVCRLVKTEYRRGTNSVRALEQWEKLEVRIEGV